MVKQETVEQEVMVVMAVREGKEAKEVISQHVLLILPNRLFTLQLQPEVAL